MAAGTVVAGIVVVVEAMVVAITSTAVDVVDVVLAGAVVPGGSMRSGDVIPISALDDASVVSQVAC